MVIVSVFGMVVVSMALGVFFADSVAGEAVVALLPASLLLLLPDGKIYGHPAFT